MSAFAILIPALRSKETPANDSGLLTQVCEGDAGAIQELFDRHATLVYWVAMRILQGSQAAEDVLHEVFMQLWREPNSFRGLDLAGSLVLLARNRAIDRLLNRLGGEYDVPALLVAPHKAAQPMEFSGACFLKYTATTEMQQSVLQMAFYEGKTMEVIGEELGVAPAAVRTQMRLGFQQGVSAWLSLPGGQSDG